MKKLLSLLLSLCMISALAVSANAIVVGESVATQEEFSLSVMSKDMKTGEVTQSIYTCESTPSKYSTALPNFVQPAWCPSNVLNGNSSINPEFDLKNVETDDDLLDGIIGGVDNRVKVTNTEVFPHSAVCYIEVDYEDDPKAPYPATAFMIGDNIAVTAGHCVYENGVWASSVKVWPGKNGYGLWNNPYGTAEEIRVLAPAWDDAEDSNSDWAVIILDENIGNDTGWFGFTWQDHSSVVNTNLTLSGYPDQDKYYQYTQTDLIMRVESYYIYYRMDTTDGQSGSPIYNSNGIVYGIHVQAFSSIENRGTRITLPIYNYLVECINNY